MFGSDWGCRLSERQIPQVSDNTKKGMEATERKEGRSLPVTQEVASSSLVGPAILFSDIRQFPIAGPQLKAQNRINTLPGRAGIFTIRMDRNARSATGQGRSA